VPRVAQADPVPQNWPSTDGGGFAFEPKILTGAEFDALRLANSELSSASTAMGGAGLGAVLDPMVGLGRAVRAGSGMPGISEILTGGANASTPFSDAQSFEYQPDAQDGDSFDIAKTPNEGDPGTWYTNPGSGQMRLYGNDRQAVVDFDFDHDHGQGIPHAHNWNDGVRGPGLPFSLLP
jgi:hypothetical protein